jgi:2-succinyl-5-enolpyruvyl-6-hydroxy-3-cyclohexene-1-carboxylate synthase
VTTTPSAASAWATEFLGSAISHGLRHVVASPGSRSQAIALAAMAYDDADDAPFSVHVVVDERSAGFFALGLATETRAPVALLCTSGSAVGHYLPALMEAHHSGTGLLVITADRPEELQGVGANQTTTQAGIYGSFSRVVFDVDAPEGAPGEAEQARDIAARAVEEAAGLTGFRPGPVHINVAFRDPLSSPHPLVARPDIRSVEPWSASMLSEPRHVVLDPEPGTVVIAGHGAGAKAEELARNLGAPLCAEVHSGAHFGPHLVVAYRDLLPTPPADISRVVCVGRPTLSRDVWALLSRHDVTQVVWQQGEPEPANPSRTALVADVVDVSEPVDDKTARAWSGPWVMASRKLLEEQAAERDAPPPNWEANVSQDMATRSRFAKEELAVFRRPVTRRSIAQGVWEATWPHDRLVVASSRMIRELDKVASGKNIPVLSTRGLSGIDGQIAFSRGVSRGIAEHATGTVRVILGDVAFLHDVGSLLRDIGEEQWGRVHLFVVVDGGGSIFDTLEAKQSSDPEHFERVLFTPASANMSALADTYGWQYMELTQFGQMPEALAHTASHLIVECRVGR